MKVHTALGFTEETCEPVACAVRARDDDHAVAGRFIDHPEAAARVARAVDDLDGTIKIIRSTIFGLRDREGGAGTGLRARVVRVVGEAARVLGFAPSARMEGLLDTDVPQEIADQVEAVLSEALTNIARHAGADRADVVLATDGSEVRLTATDNGGGIPPGGRRSGLRAWLNGPGSGTGHWRWTADPRAAPCWCGTCRCQGSSGTHLAADASCTRTPDLMQGHARV